MAIKKLTSLSEIYKLFNLYQEIYPQLTREEFTKNVNWMHANNINFICFLENNQALAAALYWEGYRFHCGHYIQIESLIVSHNFRRQKIAKKLLEYVENIAIQKNIGFYCLDVYSNNKNAIKLYAANNFSIKCFHMIKKI
jgi:ribosomal protein S18 acetylase RimI-like enzyme